MGGSLKENVNFRVITNEWATLVTIAGCQGSKLLTVTQLHGAELVCKHLLKHLSPSTTVKPICRTSSLTSVCKFVSVERTSSLQVLLMLEMIKIVQIEKVNSVIIQHQGLSAAITM